MHEKLEKYMMTFRRAFCSVIKIAAITFGLVILLGRGVGTREGEGGGGWGIPPCGWGNPPWGLGIPPSQILVELGANHLKTLYN